jgi:hypothetical protein
LATRKSIASARTSQKTAATSVVANFEFKTWIVEHATIAADASAAVDPNAGAPAKYIAGTVAVPKAAETQRATTWAIG